METLSILIRSTVGIVIACFATTAHAQSPAPAATATPRQAPPSAPPSFDAALAAFESAYRNDDPKDNWPASDALRKLIKASPPTASQKRAIYSLAASMPVAETFTRDAGWELVGMAREFMDESDLGLIEEFLPRMGRHAKGAALVNLTVPTSRRGAEAVADAALLIAKDPSLEYFSLGSYHHSPRHLDVLLPRLFDLSNADNGASFELFQLLLDWAREGTLPESKADESRRCAVRTHARLFAILQPLDARSDLSETEKLQQSQHRGVIEVIADLLGYLGGEESIQPLRNSLTLKDSGIRVWAAGSLLQLRQRMSEEELTSIADDMSARCSMLHCFIQKGVESRFPRKYRSNRALAEAHMWNWLSHEMELGEPPDKLEVAKVVTLDGPRNEKFEYYVLKFLPRATKHEPAPTWQMGVSGPFRAKGGSDLSGGGDTFSDFHEWDPEKVEQEVEHIRKRMDEARRISEPRK